MDRDKLSLYAKVGVAALLGGIVGVLVVLPLVPLILELVVGVLKGVLDVVVPGGSSDPA